MFISLFIRHAHFQKYPTIHLSKQSPCLFVYLYGIKNQTFSTLHLSNKRRLPPAISHVLVLIWQS